VAVEFGYEFIDQDWVLDFPADADKVPASQPWMASASSGAAPGTVKPGTRVAPLKIGGRPEVVGSEKEGDGPAGGGVLPNKPSTGVALAPPTALGTGNGIGSAPG